jgi:hypothetical protein
MLVPWLGTSPLFRQRLLLQKAVEYHNLRRSHSDNSSLVNLTFEQSKFASAGVDDREAAEPGVSEIPLIVF